MNPSSALKTFLLGTAACVLVQGCNGSGSSSQPSGPATPAEVHLAFQSSPESNVPNSSPSPVIQVDRTLSLRTVYDNQPGASNYVNFEALKDYDDPATTPEYRFDIIIQGSDGVKGLPDSAMTGLNADFGFFLPDVTPGKTYTCSSTSGSQPSPNVCWPSYGIYSEGNDTTDAFGRVTKHDSVSLFHPTGDYTCTLAISADSQALTYQDSGPTSYNRDYSSTGSLPMAPHSNSTSAADATKPFAFAVRCVDSQGKDLLYLTFTQNGAGVPSI